MEWLNHPLVLPASGLALLLVAAFILGVYEGARITRIRLSK